MARRRVSVVDIIRAIEGRLPRPEYRTDEVLDELLESLVTLSLAESRSLATSQVYRWGPYSNGDTEMKWTFFTWA